ncbi:DNA polymerase epsilon subunit 3, variant 2 [Schistosoma haematobium]|uniref:DNA polymerase epsilon subunit 3 n=2 Tax=Schistosoma haematobium TaxID=6185 RepID=A0A095AWF3_SCHHA|nr:DNA polymerase epsilon subunit 3, variant 2 [Schistosoma haematobium]KAH9580519.1 DNA polymerase epsilon subunit 3, variant 2 [Schistosoma haematobium]CAH8605791.1 unnamed protein product [Schistosoma haematobium]CAH8613482.1 unnamed protein product [Schistosoma haematobium]
MAEKADDLYLPNAVLLRIIRESLPERTLVSREARSAISKSASSFILYVTSLASVHCEKSKRKTLTGSDILAALKEMQFNHFIPALNAFLDKYREQIVLKKSNKRLHSENEEEISSEKLSQIPSSSTSHLKHLDSNFTTVEDDDNDDVVGDDADEEETEEVEDVDVIEVDNDDVIEITDTHMEEGNVKNDQLGVGISDDDEDDGNSQSTEALNENEDSF